jgi:predicted PurR-regulated permease PerM
MTEEEDARHHKAARAVLALLLVLAGLWTLHRYLVSLVWASILAIAVWPLFLRATRRWPPGRHNVLLPAVFTVAIGLLFAGPFIAVAFQAGREVHGVVRTIDRARTEGIPAPEFLSRLPVGSAPAVQWWNENLANPDAAAALLKRARSSEFVAGSPELGADLAHRLVQFGFTLLTLFFLFREGDVVLAQMQDVSHRLFGAAGERVGRQIIASVHGTVDGLVLVGLGEGLILGVAYWVAGVPHATLFGLVTAVAAMVPFGVVVAVGLAALVLVASGGVVPAVAIAAIGTIVSFVSDHFIRPGLIGSTTRLPFLWVLLGILGGVETWGLLGLFLGPAIMAALILLWREWSGTK